jgi:hypothetical protein
MKYLKHFNMPKTTVKIRFLISLSVLILVCLSCSFVRTGCGFYTKNADKDGADDVQEIVVSESSDGTYLTAVEWIFQGKRNTKQGIRGGHDGWWEVRVSCYDLSTGELEGRHVFGKREEAETVLLGEAGGMLWFASADKSLGFHAREIPSLEIAVTEKEILEANPRLELKKPEWNYISQQYRFDKVKNMPVISDVSGAEYYINPSTLKTEAPAEVQYYTSNPNNTASSVTLAVNKYIELNRAGNIVLDKKETKSINFYKGEFLLSTIPFYDTAAGLDDNSIITDDNCLFVLSETDGGEKSKCIITKIKMNNDNSVSVEWKTQLENIYRYPENVHKDGFLETTFHSGNPNYKTMKTALTDEGLLFIYNLKMMCIDTDDGEVMYEIDL